MCYFCEEHVQHEGDDSEFYNQLWELEEGYFIYGSGLIEGLKITYCPMCGRHLEKENK